MLPRLGVFGRLGKPGRCLRQTHIVVIDLDFISIDIGKELPGNQRGLLRRPTRASTMPRAILSVALAKNIDVCVNHADPPCRVYTPLGYESIIAHGLGTVKNHRSSIRASQSSDMVRSVYILL